MAENAHGPGSGPEDGFAQDDTCPDCGYALKGLRVPRCPECGLTFRWEHLDRIWGKTHTRREWRTIAILLGVIMLICLMAGLAIGWIALVILLPGVFVLALGLVLGSLARRGDQRRP